VNIKINSIKGLKNLIKRMRIKLKNKYRANWDGRMKLKINKTSIKVSRVKI
jgi:hypothetical protein